MCIIAIYCTKHRQLETTQQTICPIAFPQGTSTAKPKTVLYPTFSLKPPRHPTQDCICPHTPPTRILTHHPINFSYWTATSSCHLLWQTSHHQLTKQDTPEFHILSSLLAAAVTITSLCTFYFYYSCSHPLSFSALQPKLLFSITYISSPQSFWCLLTSLITHFLQQSRPQNVKTSFPQP